MRTITWGLVALLAAFLLKMRMKPVGAGVPVGDPKCVDFQVPQWSPGKTTGWFKMTGFSYCGWGIRRVDPYTGMDKNGNPAAGAPTQSYPSQTGQSDPETGEDISDFQAGLQQGWGWADELVEDIKGMF
jgi:hypothetical protein